MRVIRVRAWPSEFDYYLAPGIYSTVERGGLNIVHCQNCHTMFHVNLGGFYAEATDNRLGIRLEEQCVS